MPQACHFGQHGLAAGENYLAGIGELYGAAFAQQQRAAEFFFQALDHLADSRLGHMQGFGGAGKAVLADDFHEVAQGADIHEAAPIWRGWRFWLAIPIWHGINNLYSFYISKCASYTSVTATHAVAP